MKSHADRKRYWKDIQAIFQDPFSSFNLFYRVEKLLLDCIKLQGLKLTKEERYRKMQEACSFVNLKFEELHNKYPFELSGGQMQRLMIARIFMLHPKVLIADEPTSMVDACSRSTILDMLLKLRDENEMTIIFITHDVGLAYYVSDTIYIMEKGKIVESTRRGHDPESAARVYPAAHQRRPENPLGLGCGVVGRSLALREPRMEPEQISGLYPCI